jgi:ribosomal-protein-alanine N-acetyltransferase
MMNDFKICRMTGAEVSFVFNLIEHFNLGFWSEKALYDELERSDSICLIAKLGKKPAGFLIARLIMSENIIEIYNIGVKSELQREGIASLLLNYLFKNDLLASPFGIFLEVRASNTKARAFYLKNGFKIAGVRKNFYRDPVEDAINMNFVYEGDKVLD